MAVACRCLMQLIDPLTASTDAVAFSNDPGDRMSRGFRSSSTISTIRRPDRLATSNIFGEFASTGAAPGSVMPSASHTMCIELAVPMPAQTPGPPIALSHMPRSEEHTSELQSRLHLVCRLLLEKNKKT